MAGNPNPKTDHLKPTQFKPGQSGNPTGVAGRPLITATSYSKLAQNYFHNYSVAELRNMSKDDSLKALDRMVIGAVLKAIDSGYTADTLLQYVIGKAPDVLHQTIKDFDKEFSEAPRENILKVLRDGTGT